MISNSSQPMRLSQQLSIMIGQRGCSKDHLLFISKIYNFKKSHSKSIAFFPKKERLISKKKKSFFITFFFKLRLDLILYERGTQAAFSKRSQSSKNKLHFKKYFSKLYFFQNFVLRLDLLLYERGMQAAFSKGLVTFTKKKNHFLKDSKLRR